MITHEQAAKLFEGEAMEVTPTDKKRICIPVHNHIGSKEVEFTSWDGSKQKVVGYKFLNETDGSEQVASATDGVLMCYEGQTQDGKLRSQAVKEYLDKHPFTTKTASGVKNLVKFLNTIAISDKGTPDVYTTDLGFVAKKILGAPAKDDIQPGQVVVGQKVSQKLQAIRVGAGVEFEGAEGTASTQKAGKDGAYLLKDDSGIRMIQTSEFHQAYTITKMPANVRSDVREL